MRYLILLSLIILISACANQKATTVPTTKMETVVEKANRIAQENIITDGHVDLPYRLKIKNFRPTKEFLGIPIETDAGDFDYVRAKKGGLDAPFMSIYLPADLQKEKG